MSELEGMINSIMSNPDEMKKIMDMAGKIMGSEGGGYVTGTLGAPSSPTPSLDSILDNMNALPGGITSAAAGLLGSPTVQKLLNSSVMKNLLSGSPSGMRGDKKELFNALKPWLSEKRRYKLEKAIVFARVMNFAGAAALKRGD